MDFLTMAYTVLCALGILILVHVIVLVWFKKYSKPTPYIAGIHSPSVEDCGFTGHKEAGLQNNIPLEYLRNLKVVADDH